MLEVKVSRHVAFFNVAFEPHFVTTDPGMAEEVKPPAPPPPPDRREEADGGKACSSGVRRACQACGSPPSPLLPPSPPVPFRCRGPRRWLKNTRASTARVSTPRLIWDRTTFAVDRSLIPDILRLLRDEEQFDYCVDITAVHYPKREKQFDVVWILYSFPRNERVRVKTQIADGASIPSSVSIWATANWLEREVYDMFGIQFDGHPDLKRILLPDGWKGHPLRKDYGILQQDNEWVQINLGIESGQ